MAAGARRRGRAQRGRSDRVGPRLLHPQPRQDLFLRSGTVGGIVELYRYLEAHLVMISAAATRRERRVHGRTWRNSFLLGAVGRLAQRLDARRAEMTETQENGWALVVVKTAVDRKIERRWPELESSRYRASVARCAYEAGSRAAKDVDLGDPRLGSAPPALRPAAPG